MMRSTPENNTYKKFKSLILGEYYADNDGNHYRVIAGGGLVQEYVLRDCHAGTHHSDYKYYIFRKEGEIFYDREYTSHWLVDFADERQ